jgi:hypothetical protein
MRSEVGSTTGPGQGNIDGDEINLEDLIKRTRVRSINDIVPM